MAAYASSKHSDRPLRFRGAGLQVDFDVPESFQFKTHNENLIGAQLELADQDKRNILPFPSNASREAGQYRLILQNLISLFERELQSQSAHNELSGGENRSADR
jgi:hypothetical protein